LAPFRYIPVHVKQAPVVRLERSRREASLDSIVVGIAQPPCVVSHEFFVWLTETPQGLRTCPASKLPFGFGWQAIPLSPQVVGDKIKLPVLVLPVTPLFFLYSVLLTQPVAVRGRVVPRDRVHR